MEPEVLRTNALTALLGVSRTTLWRRVRDGDLPPPLRLGGPQSRAVGWRRAEIEAWLTARVRTSGDGGGVA